MSNFAHKPSFIDFGNKPGVRTIKFVHSCASVEITETPSWIEIVDISVGEYTSGGPHAQGYIELRPIVGMSQEKYSSIMKLQCDGEDYYIPLVYAYDSTSIPIRDVVNNLFMRSDEVSFISERDRGKAMLIAKRWIQDNVGVSGTNIRFAEMEVSHGIASVPGDFVAPIGTYVVSSDGYLLPLYTNNDINISDGQLQDNDGLYITDNNGIVIGAYGLTPRPDNERPYTYYGVDLETAWSGYRNHFKVQGGRVSLNGMCRFDASANEFVISGPGIEKVVIEYVCDPILRNQLGIDHGDLKIHKFYQEPLEMFIYYSLIELNSRVPYNEKRRALQAYKLAFKRANLRAVNWEELIQIIHGI